MRIERVVVNSSPLIILFRSGQSDLLPGLFKSIIVPEQVYGEYLQAKPKTRQKNISRTQHGSSGGMCKSASPLRRGILELVSPRSFLLPWRNRAIGLSSMILPRVVAQKSLEFRHWVLERY